MGMAVGGSKRSMSATNIVPVVDVLPVLIIIFMVITPTVPQGLDALGPQPTPPNTKPDNDLLSKTIVVQVTSNGNVLSNQAQVAGDTVCPRLEDIFKKSAENVASTKGDDSFEFAQASRAIHIMSGS